MSYSGADSQLIDYSTFSSRKVKIDTSSAATEGCSVLWKNEIYVFGGAKFSKISRISDCGLKDVGNLDFDFAKGSCGVTRNFVYLCFRLGTHSKTDFCRNYLSVSANSTRKKSRKSCYAAENPLKAFFRIRDSKNEHSYTGFATGICKFS